MNNTLEQIQARAHAANVARYLSTASPSEMAHLTGALAAECMLRSIAVSGELCLAQARLEAVAEMQESTDAG